MRIAYVVGGFPVISETFIVNQIAGMVARGCHVDIFATSKETTSRLPEAVVRYRLMERVHRLDAPQNYFLRLYRIMLLLLVYGWRAPGAVTRSVNVIRYGRSAATLGLLYTVLTLIRLGVRSYDVIHAQFGTYGLLALRLIETTGSLRGELVTSFRGYDATKSLQAHPHAYDALFLKGGLFLPVSQALAKRIVEAGCDPAKAHVHHSGIECAKFRYLEHRRAADEATRIVLIGRLVEKKGMGYGIQAIARVIASGRALSCTIVGAGPLRGELERLILKLDVGAHVRMVGSQSHDEVIQVLAQSHILLAPCVTAADGDEEGIPNTLKEAMAMGLPVISTVHAGIPELVEDGASGFLVPERNVEALADRLMRLVDHPETWVAMGRAGRRRIEAEFDIDRLNDELLELYQGMIATPEPRTLDGGTGSSSLSRAPHPVDRIGHYKRSEGSRSH
jgi:colanic acid/amylovoran biosynthesis glycosyltransferase